ncbi:MAG TPA: RNA polymerase-binding protein DksA [Rhodanobacteraceae bacterium]|jgi:DnaK suppressor protein|nr:RNA polymerase-binding protein DksA [Rhodanobacteraceae bacterium]
MAKAKQRAAKRSPKAAKPAAKAKTVKKPVAKAARKAPAKVARKVAKSAPKKSKPAKPAKPAAKKAAKTSHAGKPAKPAAPGKATHAHEQAAKHETRTHSAPAPQAHPAPAPVRKPVHVKPAGGVAARLNVAAGADEQTITREDGRYALPSTVNIDLPKNYRPSDKEEYMSPRQLAYFRQKLKDWRDQLVEESRQTMENLREEVRDVGDDAERATRETENSLELRTRDRYRKLISKIEKALRKIEEGRYGYCEETDEEIGLERLEARPIATLSLDAQERREHLQKQMGD